ncbi:hypothetical protein [Thermoactinomyces vulgaris]|jgi:hypothetical protein|uniref:hypothetical protein n=1 Tax=Thermoactinomyces vulgaris TaxID=2026 RepID=UPI00362FCE29
MAVKTVDVQIGPAIVEFGTTDPVVFNITKGGIVLSHEDSVQDVTVDQYGETPVKSILTGRTATVTVPFAVYDLEKLVRAIPNSELVTDTANPAKKQLIVKGSSGYNLLNNGDKLVIKPTDPTATPNDWVTVPVAVPSTQIELTYDNETERIYNVTFRAFPDMDNGDALFIFGDTTATEDTRDE